MAQAIRVLRNEALPPQAWLLHISQTNVLHCGANVETRDAAFFEGGWAGDFSAFNFEHSSNVCGSGAKLTQSGWLVVPPSHTLEAIYALNLADGKEWLVSNSVAFIRAFSGLRFLVSDGKLIESFVGIVRGIQNSPRAIPSSRGNFYILHHHNGVLGPSKMTIRPKNVAHEFGDFSDYKAYLQNELASLSRNAADPLRRRQYRPLTTISSGYDSPACAALAASVGCRDAITFVNARDGGCDDGSFIAGQLGLECLAFRRSESVNAPAENVAEFLATGMQGEDTIYEALRGQLQGHLFVTGFHGDKIWDLHARSNAVLARGDISGSSLGEFRLAEGFIHVPLPIMGAQQHAAVRRISRSSEMAAFSIGGAYDRPIPRRIAEEAGVPRNEFGQQKNAISLMMFRDFSLFRDDLKREIERQLCERSLLSRALYKLKAALFTAETSFQELIFEICYRLGNIFPFCKALLQKKLPFFVIQILAIGRDLRILEHSHPFNALAFCWSIERVAMTYRSACRAYPDDDIESCAVQKLELG